MWSNGRQINTQTSFVSNYTFWDQIQSQMFRGRDGNNRVQNGSRVNQDPGRLTCNSMRISLTSHVFSLEFVILNSLKIEMGKCNKLNILIKQFIFLSIRQVFLYKYLYVLHYT